MKRNKKKTWFSNALMKRIEVVDNDKLSDAEWWAVIGKEIERYNKKKGTEFDMDDVIHAYCRKYGLYMRKR